MCVCFWITFLFVGAASNFGPDSNDRSSRIQERKGLSDFQLSSVLDKQGVKDGVDSLVRNVGGTAKVTGINYDGPPSKVFKEVGDAVIPLITTELALIPGGAVIGGTMAGVWNVLSPFLVGDNGKSSLKLLVNDLKKDFEKLKGTLNSTIQKHTNAKLSKLLETAINHGIRRNAYICSKYAILSEAFSDDLKNNRTINETLRMEMVAVLHDCDNFLKDVVVTFMDPEYADILWVPSIVVTLIRISYLTEITNYGFALGLEKNVLHLFASELNKEVVRTFKFADFGIRKRLESSLMPSLRRFNFGNFTPTEYEGCQLQAQLLYLDRRLYPRGVPHFVRIYDDDSEVKIGNYCVTENDDACYVQVYYNEMWRRFSGKLAPSLLNCISGPERLVRFPLGKMTFRVAYDKKKVYQMRLLYFIPEMIYEALPRNIPNRLEVRKLSSGRDRHVTVTEDTQNTLNIVIANGKSTNSVLPRFEIKSGFHQLDSLIGYKIKPQEIQYNKERTAPSGNGFSGTYVIETFHGVIVESDDETTGKIIVNFNYEETILFAVEFIVMSIPAGLNTTQ